MKTKQVLRQVEKYIAAKAQYAGLYGIVQERPATSSSRTLKGKNIWISSSRFHQ